MPHFHVGLLPRRARPPGQEQLSSRYRSGFQGSCCGVSRYRQRSHSLARSDPSLPQQRHFPRLRPYSPSSVPAHGWGKLRRTGWEGLAKTCSGFALEAAQAWEIADSTSEDFSAAMESFYGVRDACRRVIVCSSGLRLRSILRILDLKSCCLASSLQVGMSGELWDMLLGVGWQEG